MILPMLELETRDGASFSWLELWQRQNVLLLIAHPSCETCRRVLADWAEQADALRLENTTPVAIFSGDPGDVPAGIRVLLDPEERMAGRLGASAGTVLAIDRFFEIRSQDDAHLHGADETAADSLSWVKLAERECPECGVGTW